VAVIGAVNSEHEADGPSIMTSNGSRRMWQLMERTKKERIKETSRFLISTLFEHQ
jgi:hypothetical protein